MSTLKLKINEKGNAAYDSNNIVGVEVEHEKIHYIFI